MIRIGTYEFDNTARYQIDYANATIMVEILGDIPDEEFNDLKRATLMQAYTSIDKVETLIAEYNLVSWKSVEKTGRGYRFVWYTYKPADIESLRQDNEDLTEALLELAAIVGGGENG